MPGMYAHMFISYTSLIAVLVIENRQGGMGDEELLKV